MHDDRAEIPLRGGRVTQGVVRVGDTVRRPPTANSEFVGRLLQHLAAKGFGGAPVFLGSDERGRDVLTFIDGEVPADLGFYDDETLCKAAFLIRRFHDLSAELLVAPAVADIEVICHNDLSPCNFVFSAGMPVALIDFDAAAPGSRVHDLGYAAWLWLNLGSPEMAAADQRRRLALFLEAYGTVDHPSVLAAMLTRQTMLVEEGRRLGNEAMASWAADSIEWTRRYENLLVGA
ncbi:MAG: phosphotransferase [Candidatus Nanopelagicales bacterium]